MITMTRTELQTWKQNYVKEVLGGKPYIEINGVYIGRSRTNCLTFSFKKAQGLVFADNGYLGPQKDGKDYYPQVKLSPFYTNEAGYCPSCDPTPEAIASAVKESWKSFTS